MGIDEFHEGVVVDKYGNQTFHLGVVMFVCLVLGISVKEANDHVGAWWDEQVSKYSDRVATWTIL